MKIKELIVYTQNLKSQIDFYSKVLEFEILHQNDISCRFKLGDSILSFIYQKNATPYHFAFNIPSNKADEALIWLKQRINILPFNGKEMVDFKSWNAKALYFYDYDKNIVEFISRKNINMHSYVPFSSKDILNISEIGVSSTDMEKTFKTINVFKLIDVYSGNFERFCALGNDEGMFIIANPTVKKWFPNDDVIEQSDFILKGDYNFEFKNGEFMPFNS